MMKANLITIAILASIVVLIGLAAVWSQKLAHSAPVPANYLSAEMARAVESIAGLPLDELVRRDRHPVGGGPTDLETDFAKIMVGHPEIIYIKIKVQDSPGSGNWRFYGKAWPLGDSASLRSLGPAPIAGWSMYDGELHAKDGEDRRIIDYSKDLVRQDGRAATADIGFLQ